MAGVNKVEVDMREAQDDTASPPSYEAAIAPPPSYDSIQAKIKQAKEESSGKFQFVGRACSILLTTIGFTIFLGLFLAVPISMIAMGGIHWDDCPAETGIPVYLVVAGAVGCLSVLYPMVTKGSESENTEEDCKLFSIGNLLVIINFASFITGSVYVFQTKDKFQSDYSDREDYCEHSLYYFAFWVLMSVYIVLGLLFACIISFFVYMCADDD